MTIGSPRSGEPLPRVRHHEWRRSASSTSAMSYRHRCPRTWMAGISLVVLILTMVRRETPRMRESSAVVTSLDVRASVVVLRGLVIIMVPLTPYLPTPIGRAPKPRFPRKRTGIASSNPATGLRMSSTCHDRPDVDWLGLDIGGSRQGQTQMWGGNHLVVHPQVEGFPTGVVTRPVVPLNPRGFPPGRTRRATDRPRAADHGACCGPP